MKRLKNRIKKEYILYCFILLAFIILALIIGYNHEPWSDEAQAWLIARDTTIFSLFGQYLHSEGHPALWYLILKLFINCGLTYKYLFIVPIIFSSIGISIFLFKSRFPWYIKLLLPFTYFIFYQYTIVARGYCLLLPILCSIACIWDRKREKCFLFTVLLILLMNTEAYTYIFAGLLYLTYLYEFIKNYKKTNNKKKNILCLIILTISFLLVILYVYPLKTNVFNINKPYELFYISDAFITSANSSDNLKMVISSLIPAISFLLYKKNNLLKQFIQLIAYIIPICLLFTILYQNKWHYGIILEIFIFIIWIQKLERKKFIIIIFLVTSLCQIVWSCKTSVYDYYKNYSPSKEVANFIKKYDYNNLEIFGDEFIEVAVNPYFDKNIYYNWDEDVSFFYLDQRNEYFKYLVITNEYIDELKPDMIVAVYKQENSNILDYYNRYSFEGGMYYQNKKIEIQGLDVYVLKEIDN